MKTKKIKLNDEEFARVVRLAFDLGESWGTTYQGWFIPTDTDKELRFSSALSLCLSEVEEIL